MLIVFILLIVFLVILLVFLINNKINTDNILYHFRKGNVIVSGKKGKGKDLLFNWVINKRKKYYYSNISYGGKHKIISLNDVSCSPNDYDKLINNNVVKTNHLFKESCDIYVSDGGNFLPSQMDSTLHKKYPSMPLIYSLSRHLYDNNIHVNTQNIERVWKALREQADFYVTCKKTSVILGFIFITKVVTYDKYESCKSGLLPLKKRSFNKMSKSQYDLFVSQNGDIRYAYVIQLKRNIKYNTRAFEKILLKGKRKY